MARQEFVKNTSSAEELHQLALCYDPHYEGIDTMIDIIRNPACDKNTVLFLFWRCNPADFQETYKSRDEIEEWNREDKSKWDLIHFIMDNTVKGKYGPAKMPDDYKEEIFRYSPHPEKPFWEIPPALFGKRSTAKSKKIMLNKYDKKFGAYGPHCIHCKKSIDSLKLHKCPHCSKTLLCDCEFCRKDRGEI